jgi:hypothetical protein
MEMLGALVANLTPFIELVATFLLIILARISLHNINRYGDSESFCLTPLEGENEALLHPLSSKIKLTLEMH